MTTRAIRNAGRASLALAGTALLILGSPGRALADTSQATGQAAAVQVLGQPVVSSGQVSASNDGTGQAKSGNSTPALSVLGAQTLLSSGALFQDAVASNNGTSAACAGVVGAGGTVQVGPTGTCVVSGAPAGVVLNLGLAVLRADVVTAACSASSSGTTTGTATLTNARITDPTGAVTLLALPVNPAPNTMLSVPGIVDLVLNQQSSATGGQLAVTALRLTVLGGVGGGAQVQLGGATCGANARTSPTPVLTSAGLPVAAATLLACAAVAWLALRPRLSTRADA